MTTIHTNKNKLPPRKSLYWYNQNFFKYTVVTLILLTTILVFYKVAVVLTPILDFASILATPVILSLLIYYLLRPIVHFLEKYKIPRYVSVIFIYGAIGCLLAFFIVYIGPIIAEQLTALANNSVETLDKIKTTSKSLFFQIFNLNLDKEIETRILSIVQYGTSLLSRNIVDLVGLLTRIATILAVIPFIVFYLLKDDHGFINHITKYVSDETGKEVAKIINDVDKTLSSYITSLVIVSSSVGGMLFIGYWIIGLNYALILSFIALIFTTIPFLGPFLAISPAIMVGFSDSPLMIVKVITVFVIVQQLESNIISPQVIGQRLHIHPLTIILLLLAAGSLYGLVGLILATPLYAVGKTLAISLYKIYELHSSNWRKKLSSSTFK